MSKITAFLLRIWQILKNNKWKSILGALALLLVVWIISAVTAPKAPEYITELSKRGDLTQTVEAVGTVISEKDLELQFRSSGIVGQVLVKDGDTVKAGQRLASIRAGDLSASVAAAVARMRQAEAALRALQEGTRPEEIAIAEAQLQNKRANLETAKATLKSAEETFANSQTKLTALKQEVNTALAGQVSLAGSTASEQVSVAEQALLAIDSIFGQNDVIEAVTYSNPSAINSIRSAQNSARTALLAIRTAANPLDYQAALVHMQNTQSAIQKAIDALTLAYSTIDATPEISNFTHDDKETHKSTLNTKVSAARGALTAINTWMQGLKDASASYTTRIATEESALTSSQGTMDRAKADIATYQTSILIDEANLALKRAGARQTDIDSAKASLDAARAEVARASASVGETIITAPIDGRVTKVNVKVGEITPVGAAITMIGDSPYRVEMFVSEIDIPKVQLTQSGSIELDAFPGTHYALHVSEIDEAQTLVEGVSKYRVKLDFVHPHDEFKIGMTGDAEIITGIRTDVVSVPRRAVLERDSGEYYVRIIKDDGSLEERDVTIGMESGGGEVEVVTGLQEDETVVVLVKE